MIGVLFDGFAYGMLLFLLSVGLSVTLGMMNFVNLAHCAFAMLGGYVTVTLMNSFAVAVPRDAAVRVPGRRAGQRRVRARALPPALSGERSRPGAAHHRNRLRVGRGRGLSLRHDPAAGADAVLSARLGDGPRADLRRLPAVPDRRRARRHAAAGRRARIHPLRRAGARRGRQPAHGARARHQCRRLRLPSPSRSARASPASAARSRSRSSGSIRPSHSPIWSTC